LRQIWGKLFLLGGEFEMLKKFLAVLAIISVLFCMSACSNAGESVSSKNPSIAESLVKIDGDSVIITVDGNYLDITETTVLLDYMKALKNDGVLDYSLSNDGMVIAINGRENPADWSKCWMLYSNDIELTNEAWGTVTIDGVTYFSAILGAESLPIKDGKIYVWEFKSF
jgi:hypothetical protein